VRLGFRRRLRHPFYPALKLSPAIEAGDGAAALCGGFEELCRAAAAGTRASRAVFPLRPPSDPFLPRSERDALWNMFEVPVYALLLDGDGQMIGYECEAQHGLHIVDTYRPGLLFGRIESATCECGRPGPRLIPPLAIANFVPERVLLAG
jgi:hypothetical protein